MSNIIDKNILDVLKELVNSIYDTKYSTNRNCLEEILKKTLPKDDGKLLISYNIKDDKKNPAMFIPNKKTISLSINKINEWIDYNTNSFIKSGHIKDINIYKSYLCLFLIMHEIEHSYQYLISENIISVPSKIISTGYKYLFDLLVRKDYVIPRPIKQTRKILSLFLYKSKENFYVLERNANLESIDLICKCALSNGRDDIYDIFLNIKNIVTTCGYNNSAIGSIKETFKGILMYDKYIKFHEETNIDEEKKVRYGLTISEEKREQILCLSKKSKI